jgi:hypothetical protein
MPEISDIFFLHDLCGLWSVHGLLHRFGIAHSGGANTRRASLFFQVFTCPPFLRKVAMYVLRHSGNASCGYLEAGGKYFALQPHPASGVPRLIFPHGQVQISGRVNAIASPL